ncbi:DUF5347 family protein [Providencia rustigianii]|uniref:DUF5347 family protein n=1 Tax=Providencia rustigianii TaxID=158850 RepID=UPI0038B27F02
MSTSVAELIKTKKLIQFIDNEKQDEKTTKVIEQQANIKLYKNLGGTLSARVYGMNQAARLRTKIFHTNKGNPDNRELVGFIEYLRLNDERMLNMILYLAEIKNSKHHLSFDDFNKEEKQSIISAINQIKALAALLPKHIAMPI